jgi:hypothetical protein
VVGQIVLQSAYRILKKNMVAAMNVIMRNTQDGQKFVLKMRMLIAG